MSTDGLSISSLGIEGIREEYQNRANLYTDLDQLEQDAQAELNQYMNQARSFPFNEDMENGDENEFTPQESGINEESPYGTLEGDSADEVLGHIDTNVDSLQQYLDDRVENGNELGNSRSTSPGEYFGARSLPLGSVDRLWEQPQIDSQQHDSVRNDQYSYSSYTSQDKKKSAIDDLIDSKFKSLPKSIRLFPKYELPEIELHHPYTQERTHSNGSLISSTHQQCSSRDQRESRNSSSNRRSYSSLSNRHGYRSPISNNNCIIEPSSPLRFLCELSSKTIYAKVIHLKITNPICNSVRTFNLYSTKNMLDFEFAEGMIQAQETIDIKIKIRSSSLIPYQRQQFDGYPSLSDKILVLIDHSQVNELDVLVDFMTLDDDEEEEEEEDEASNDLSPSPMTGRPKCKFCALEKGYPLHSL